MHFVQILEKSKKKLKIGVQWLTWSGILALVSAGGWLVYIQDFQKTTEAVALPIIKVEQSNVEITINESGTLELGGQQSLKSPGEVAVERVLVKEGDRITSGQQLLILRNPQQQNSLATQDLQIRKQELSLERSRQKVLEAGQKLALAQKQLQEPVKQQLEIRKQELKLARNREKAVEAKQKLASEQKELQNLEVLSVKGFIPGNELQQQQAKVREAEASLKDAMVEVNTISIELEGLTLEKQRASEQQDKVLTAQAELKQAQSDVNTQMRELQRLQVERRNIEAQLKNNVVTAPISGKVLDVKVKNGDGIKSGDILLTIGNPAQELVKLQLGTLDATKVRINQQARIRVIGPNTKVFSGRVQSLHPLAISNNSSGSGQAVMPGGSSGQAKVPATVQLDKPSGSLIPGSQVSVEIIVQQRQNVVAVNLEAIQRSEAQPFVWVRDNQGKAQKRIVTLGLEGATRVEVKSGLKPGDQIILPSPNTPLEPGMPIIEGSPVPSPGVMPT